MIDTVVTIMLLCTGTSVFVVHGDECFVGENSSSESNNWHWVLTPEDPCQCTSLSRKEQNTKAYLISDDMNSIRSFLRVTCETSDSEKPVIVNMPTNISQSTDSGASTATVNWIPPTAHDNSGSQVLTSSHSPGASFTIGVTWVKYTSTDPSNNAATEMFTVTVLDTELPVIVNMPDNITQGTDIGQITATVIWTQPTAHDNSGSQTLTSSHTAGASFPVGATDVAYTATDPAGNTATEILYIQICISKLGMEDGRILDEQLTASPIQYSHSTASEARLNGGHYWLPSDFVDSWINIDLINMHIVTGVITQGADIHWVQFAYVRYKDPATNELLYIQHNGEKNKFAANTDPETPVTTMFDTPVSTTAIQIEPVDCVLYNNNPWCKLRLEILGCSVE